MLETCRTLSHWWFGTPLDAHFTTLPLRPKSTIAAPLEGWERKADLVVDPRYAKDWPFAVECKKDESWRELEKALESPKAALWKWWKQCIEQAETWKNAYPLLIFSRAHRKTYVLAHSTTFEWLHLKPNKGPLVMIARSEEEQLTLALLDDLVGLARPRRSLGKKRSRVRYRKSST